MNGLEVHEKMLKFTNYHRNANLNQMRYLLLLLEWLQSEQFIIGAGKDVKKENSCVLLVGM